MNDNYISVHLARLASRAKHLMVPIGFFISMMLLAPLREALQLGGDEGYELIKGLLCSKGFALYSVIWNDQPPLFTFLLASLFRLLGPSAYVGRLLSLGCATLLVGSFYELVRRRSDDASALIAAFFLVLSPHFLELSVSAMIELPAVSLGLAATLAMLFYTKTRKLEVLVLSGVLMGCALQTKLTAGILIPAMLAELLKAEADACGKAEAFQSHWNKSVRKFTPLLRNVSIWAGAIGTTFGFIAYCFAGEGIDLLLGSHFESKTQAAFANQTEFGFSGQLLLANFSQVLPASIGIWIVLKRKSWDCLFPIVLLFTSLLVHGIHRPYWYYYYLHLAIPFSWLSGVAVRLTFKMVADFCSASLSEHRLRMCGRIVLWSATVSVSVCDVPERLNSGLSLFRSARLSEEDYVLKTLRAYGPVTRWIYTDRVIYAFQAGLLVPPEVAVVPLKRIASGRITSTDILNCLKRYKPEQIVFFDKKPDSEDWNIFLNKYYVRVNGGHSAWCYVSNGAALLQPIPAKGRRAKR